MEMKAAAKMQTTFLRGKRNEGGVVVTGGAPRGVDCQRGGGEPDPLLRRTHGPGLHCRPAQASF